MKTLVLANQKGGVGKSAVATLLAQYLVKTGQRVLAIDLDHQGHFSKPITRSMQARVADVTSEQLLSTVVTHMPRERFVLVPAVGELIALERQATLHSPFARNLRAFLKAMDDRFDVCVIDTHPNPDIRMISALVSADFVLSPIQLNLEAIEGVGALLAHPRVGVQKIKALLNPKLQLIGLLPTQVEPTPFQRTNFRVLIERYLTLMIRMGAEGKDVAAIPKRSAIAEAQADGLLLWEMKKTAARDAWVEIEPTMKHLASIVTHTAASHAL